MMISTFGYFCSKFDINKYIDDNVIVSSEFGIFLTILLKKYLKVKWMMFL
jgi:hypothetical protein